MFKKLTLAFLAIVLSSLLYCATNFTYTLDPDKSYVDHVHYDKEMRLIIIQVHAHVLWMTFNEAYGIKVHSDKDIEPRLKEMMGDTVEIVHLKVIKGQ
jgi:hypothetical protein